eukprot:366103-Chlamydomonas_euryale.AAC.7
MLLSVLTGGAGSAPAPKLPAAEASGLRGGTGGGDSGRGIGHGMDGVGRAAWERDVVCGVGHGVSHSVGASGRPGGGGVYGTQVAG